MATPYSLRVLDEVVSTQDEARADVAPDRPAVVVAHRQTGGRGRSGASWETAPRAVAVSVGWDTELPHESRQLIPLVVGVATRRATDRRVSLKWPNDLMVGEAKVGGILVEVSADVVVAGVGINLWWPDPVPGAAALEMADPGPDEVSRLGVAIAEEILELVEKESWPRQEYVEACSTLGRDITWAPAGRGRAVDIGDDGALVVVDELGSTLFLSSGAVRHVR